MKSRIRSVVISAILSLAVLPLAAQQKPAAQVAILTAQAHRPAHGEFSPRILQRLRVPAGFRVNVFARGLGGPRMLAVGEDGTVYVTRRDSGDVLAIADDGGRAGRIRKVVTNLPHVHGIALSEGRIYLANIKEIYSAPIDDYGMVGALERLVDDLPDGGQHPNRTIAIGPDGKLYVSVGSTCNVCIEPNQESATVLRMNTDGTGRGVYVRGLRNTIGFDWDPATDEMWGLDHGSDWRGDDLPPEELNKLQNGSHYGWPFCYANLVVDQHFTQEPAGGSKTDFCRRTTAPVLTYQAHSAPLQSVFYTGSQFPAGYRNNLFVAFRGSWNRSVPTGYKVVRVRFRNGQPVGFEDFLTGFLSVENDEFVARLAGLTVARDGSLLIADDANGVIYRVSYGRGATDNPLRGLPAPTPNADAEDATSPPPTEEEPHAQRVSLIAGLKEPESVIYDEAQDVYFISNMNGLSQLKDNNGFITRVHGDGTMHQREWVQGGRAGVVLHAPKGMALVGETLWVTDIDVVRVFSARTGAHIRDIDLSAQGATFLNDLTAAPDGTVYLTDSAFQTDALGVKRPTGRGRVFRITGRSVSIALQSERLKRPNGIVWNANEEELVLAPFDGDTILTWRSGVAAPDALAAGPGQFDGVVVTSEGEVLVSSQATQAVYAIEDGQLHKVIANLPGVADIGYDHRRQLVLVPLTGSNRVEFYRINPLR